MTAASKSFDAVIPLPKPLSSLFCLVVDVVVVVVFWGMVLIGGSSVVAVAQRTCPVDKLNGAPATGGAGLMAPGGECSADDADEPVGFDDEDDVDDFAFSGRGCCGKCSILTCCSFHHTRGCFFRGMSRSVREALGGNERSTFLPCQENRSCNKMIDSVATAPTVNIAFPTGPGVALTIDAKPPPNSAHCQSGMRNVVGVVVDDATLDDKDDHTNNIKVATVMPAADTTSIGTALG